MRVCVDFLFVFCLVKEHSYRRWYLERSEERIPDFFLLKFDKKKLQWMLDIYGFCMRRKPKFA